MWKFKVEVDGVQYPVTIEAGVMSIPTTIVEKPARVFAQAKGYPVSSVTLAPCAVVAPPDPPPADEDFGVDIDMGDLAHVDTEPVVEPVDPPTYPAGLSIPLRTSTPSPTRNDRCSRRW